MSHLNVFKRIILGLFVLIFAISCSSDSVTEDMQVIDEETISENPTNEENTEEENSEEEEEVVEEKEEIIEGPQNDPYDENAFITTWETAYETDDILIRTNPDVSTPYNYTVNWGDGTIETGLSENARHEYAIPGVYTIQITGDFPAIYQHSDWKLNAKKLRTVENWGAIKWESMNRAFNNSENLILNATDVPDFSKVTDMYAMFANATYFNSELKDWDVSHVTDMGYMFYEANNFNQDISTWDVSNVTSMTYMFFYAKEFDQNISTWDVGKVTLMQNMFYGADVFNSPIGEWNVSNVTDMHRMFFVADVFNQDISKWDVSKVTNMEKMFRDALLFRQNLTGWATDNVTECTSFGSGSSLADSQLPTEGSCFGN